VVLTQAGTGLAAPAVFELKKRWTDFRNDMSMRVNGTIVAEASRNGWEPSGHARIVLGARAATSLTYSGRARFNLYGFAMMTSGEVDSETETAVRAFVAAMLPS
jgi:hypothetical protein